MQCPGIRRIGDFLAALQQIEHFFQVQQVLLELAVDGTQEIQRDVNLDHEGVDHHQIAQRHAPIHHALGGAPQHGDQTGGDDELLACVEHAQGALTGQRSAAVALQVFVVTAGFERFVVEVFDGLEVQQGVDGTRVGARVELIHAATELGAPLGHADRERHINNQGDERDPGEPNVKLHCQQCEHQRQLNQRGNNAVERIRDQGMDRARATLDVAGHAAGLPLQVKAQAHAVQMPEYLQGDAARRALGRFGKHQVTQLGEQGCTQAQRGIGHQQTQGHHQQRCGCVGARCQVVDQGFEQQRHTHIGHFRPDHESQRQAHPPFVFPQIGEQALQRAPVTRGHGAVCGLGDCRGRVAHGGQSSRLVNREHLIVPMSPATPLPTDQELVLKVIPMPADCNVNGDIFGGWVMAQVDMAGAVIPARYTRGRMATVAVNEFVFKQPVRVGDILSFFSKVARVGRTSVTVKVEVFAERMVEQGRYTKVTEALLTYVALDSDGRPRPLPLPLPAA